MGFRPRPSDLQFLITMMTLRTALFCALALSLSISSAAQAQQGKIATIDLKKVFDNYWKRVQADKELKERAKGFDDELAKMREEFERETKDLPVLEKGIKDPLISAAEKEKRQKAFEAKVIKAKELEQSMRQFSNTARATLDEVGRQSRGSLLDEIRDHIRRKAKAEGVSLVIDTASETINQTPVILYSDGSNDWTSGVLATLNNDAPKEILEQLKNQ
jgi:outer membrane protein